MSRLLGPGWGLLLLLAFGGAMLGLSLLAERRAAKRWLTFLVADREVGLWSGALSIASSWIWAPALFISSQKAYEQGVAGLFWFLVPNVLCLVLFAPLAVRIRALFPEGVTLPDFVRERFGVRAHVAYLVQFLSLQVCSFGVQLLAGAALLQAFTGLPFALVCGLLTGIVLAYSFFRGLPASVLTDAVEMLLIYAVIIIVVPWAVSEAGGWSAVQGGLAGLSGRHGNVFDPEVAWSFGLVVTIGLLAGPVGDQQHWQRAFALRRGLEGRAFLLGALLFGVVPLGLSLLGFVAASPSLAPRLSVPDPQLVGAQVVARLLPGWALVLFVIMVLAGLASTLDSVLCAVSALGSVDIVRRYLRPEADETSLLRFSRIFMVLTAVLGLGVALIPGMKILYLFLFYGTLRAATLVPTVLGLFWTRVTGRGVFWGVVTASAVGLPVFGYGSLRANAEWKVAGSLLVIGLSTALTVGLSLWAGPRDPAASR